MSDTHSKLPLYMQEESLLRFPSNIYPDMPNTQDISSIDEAYLNNSTAINRLIQDTLDSILRIEDIENQDPTLLIQLYQNAHLIMKNGYDGTSFIKTEAGLFRAVAPRTGGKHTAEAVYRIMLHYNINYPTESFNNEELSYVANTINSFLPPEEQPNSPADLLQAGDIDTTKLHRVRLTGWVSQILEEEYGPMATGFIYDGRVYHPKPELVSTLLEKAQSELQKFWTESYTITYTQIDAFYNGKEDKQVTLALSHLGSIYRVLSLVHPFETVNNSITMVLVNALLSKLGFKQIPHMKLDHWANYMPEEGFMKRFVDAVRNNGIDR
jgi:hypothetical protein